MRLRFATVLIAAACTFVSPAAAAAPKPGLEGAACVRGSASSAAPDLYGTGTEVLRVERRAGLPTALASEPHIAPGTRHRMVRVGRGWCDAEAGLNAAWLESGRRVGDGRALAAAYAALAGAPYFDGVRIVSQRSAVGVHRIRTHARTNGVVADWVVVTDAGGVRSARWTAVDLGVKPFVAQIEGLTARPGASERYTRAGGGLLHAVRGLPTGHVEIGRDDPAAEISYTTSDGFKIIFSIGDSQNAVDPGQDTGQSKVDIVREIRDMVGENMEEFLRWGFRSEWTKPAVSVGLVRLPGTEPVRPEKTGYVYVNDSTSLVCFACVFIADDFNIHILSEFAVVLQALGYSYPPERERDAFSDVLGHEIFHNFQNSYTKPEATQRTTPGFYSEGTARFQETLHSYSDISHQPESLVYANDANGCNGHVGEDADEDMARGPFRSSYSACHFWMPFYGTYGIDALRRLVTSAIPQAAGEVVDDDQNKLVRAVELASGRPMHEAAGIWARGSITGKNLSWNTPLGGPVFDWGRYLERWAPKVLAVGESSTRTLGPGGVMAHEILAPTRPVLEAAAGDEPAPRLIVLRDAPSGATLTYPASGEYVFGPAAGERVYVMVTRSGGATADTTLRLGAPGEPPSDFDRGSLPGPRKAVVACGKPRRRTVTCRMTGLKGRSVSARLLRSGRLVGTGRARVRAGRATLRVRLTRKVTGRAKLVLTIRTKSGKRTKLRHTIRAS